ACISLGPTMVVVHASCSVARTRTAQIGSGPSEGFPGHTKRPPWVRTTHSMTAPCRAARVLSVLASPGAGADDHDAVGFGRMHAVTTEKTPVAGWSTGHSNT